MAYVPISEFEDQLYQDKSHLPIHDYGNTKNQYSLSIIPDVMNFLATANNHVSQEQTAVLINNGYDDVIISNAYTVGPFALKEPIPTIVRVGEAVGITVTFNPMGAGEQTGGLYINTGNAAGEEFVKLTGSGSGVPVLSTQYVVATNVGNGSPNYIQATTEEPIPAADGKVLIVLNITQSNTAAVVQVAFNFDPPLTIKKGDGTDVGIGYLVPNTSVIGYRLGDTYRLLIDSMTASLIAYMALQVAEAEEQAERAEAAADEAEAIKNELISFADSIISQGNVPIYGSVSTAAAITIPAGITTIQLNGFNATGDGGEAMYRRTTTAPTHPGKFRSADRFLPNGTTDADNGGWWVIATKIIRPEMFGAKGDGVTNDFLGIQAARDVVIGLNRGTLHFDARTYIINTAIRCLPGCSFRGSGIDQTIIKLGVGGINAFLPNDTANVTATISVSDMTIWGHADRSMTIGTNKLVEITNFGEINIDRVKVIYSRNMGLFLTAPIVNVRNCEVFNCLRQGIELSGSKRILVQGCSIENIAYDAISANIPAGVAGIYDSEIRIIGNHYRKCYGIRALGARSTVIMGNTGRFWAGYGILVGYDTTSAEGTNALSNVTIANNVLMDGYNTTLLGSALNAFYAIGIMPPAETLGTAGGQPRPAYEGFLSSGAIMKPGPYNNMTGYFSTTPSNIAYPRGASTGIMISNNVIKQGIERTPTDTALTKFSDAGFGTLWYTSGPIDPALTTMVQNGMYGVHCVGSFRGLNIKDNDFEGVNNGVNVSTSSANNSLKNVAIDGNVFRRVKNGVVITGSLPGANGDVHITANIFDIDPFFDNANRTTPFDGSWTIDTGADGHGILLTNIVGVFITQNSFANCKRTVYVNTSVAFTSQNRCLWEWPSVSGGAPNKGIMTITAERDQLSFYRVSDPNSATYLQYSATADSAFVRSNQAMPTTGFYRTGHFSTNAASTATTPNASNMLLRGWIRKTDGNAHVAGTDWNTVYDSVVSPAT